MVACSIGWPRWRKIGVSSTWRAARGRSSFRSASAGLRDARSLVARDRRVVQRRFPLQLIETYQLLEQAAWLEQKRAQAEAPLGFDAVYARLELLALRGRELWHECASLGQRALHAADDIDEPMLLGRASAPHASARHAVDRGLALPSNDRAASEK